MSKIADAYYNEGIDFEKSEKLIKLEKRLEEQEKQLIDFRENEIKLREKGDKLYEEYSKVEEIIKNSKKRKIEIEF